MNLIQCNSIVNTTKSIGRKIRYIVIHYTAGRTSRAGMAKSTALYFANPSVKASADFIVDDEFAVQFNGDIRNRYCWHAGSSIGKYRTKGGSLYGIANSSNSIGIEVCSSSKTGEVAVPNASYFYFTEAVIKNTVELVKQLMREYGIDSAHVIRHYDVTGKLCPGIVGWNLDSGSEFAWQQFKKRLTGGAVPVVETKPIEKKEYAPEPDWSKKEGWWAKATELKIVDGSRPEEPLKRDEAIAILGRLGLIK